MGVYKDKGEDFGSFSFWNIGGIADHQVEGFPISRCDAIDKLDKAFCCGTHWDSASEFACWYSEVCRNNIAVYWKRKISYLETFFFCNICFWQC